jgi:hypothetical protein
MLWALRWLPRRMASIRQTLAERGDPDRLDPMLNSLLYSFMRVGVSLLGAVLVCWGGIRLLSGS